MSNIIPFPISNPQCQAASIGGLSTPELRERAKWNFYTDLRRRGVDHIKAVDQADAFAADMDRINARFEVQHG
jgi:hypothetical protein